MERIRESNETWRTDPEDLKSIKRSYKVQKTGKENWIQNEKHLLKLKISY